MVWLVLVEERETIFGDRLNVLNPYQLIAKRANGARCLSRTLPTKILGILLLDGTMNLWNLPPASMTNDESTTVGN